MTDESIRIAVALQSLEGRIDALVSKLEVYIETHKHEHAMIAATVVEARKTLDRELHTLNGLKLEMDKERNLLASKDSVFAVRDEAAKGDDLLDKRITEIKEDAEKRMAEIERMAGGSSGSVAGAAKANAAWIGGILLALALLGFLLKYIFDK